MDSVIEVNDLSMIYKAPIRDAGLRAALASLFRRTYREIQAIREISFTLKTGEIIGFIGPNGAGKTTTLKILSGILHPTAGQVSVLGFTPWQRKPAFLQKIALIRGSQPIGGPDELTVLDALRFQQLVYELAETAFQKHLALLVDMLRLEPLLRRHIRALSLGERMRCGLALSLIYRPRVLFLDEPTLGLDVTAVQLMRRFLSSYSQQTGATILLTSHAMADVEALCRRILLIGQGNLRYDGDLATLSATFSSHKLLKITFVGETSLDWQTCGEVVTVEPGSVTLRVPREQVAPITAQVLSELTVIDLSVEDPSLESIIGRVYAEGGI